MIGTERGPLGPHKKLYYEIEKNDPASLTQRLLYGFGSIQKDLLQGNWGRFFLDPPNSGFLSLATLLLSAVNQSTHRQ